MDGMTHVGHIDELRGHHPSQGVLRVKARPGERVVGHIGGYPVVAKPKPQPRYVLDEQTGAVHFEHDIGPKASAAMDRIGESVKNVELSLDHLRETVSTLKSPVRRTLLIAGAVLLTGLLVGGATYYYTRSIRKKKRKSRRED